MHKRQPVRRSCTRRSERRQRRYSASLAPSMRVIGDMFASDLGTEEDLQQFFVRHCALIDQFKTECHGMPYSMWDLAKWTCYSPEGTRIAQQEGLIWEDDDDPAQAPRARIRSAAKVGT